MAESSKAKKSDQMSQDKVVGTFQRLRTEQRAIASKMSELDGEKTEHKSVIKALKEVSPERRCFRLVGGVLVERQVKDVLPALEYNLTRLSSLLDKLSEQLTAKGKELNAFKEKHKILLSDEAKEGGHTPSAADSNKTSSGGVLVT